ncbi:hypothetical protein [Frankia nepalensis]|nr:hypothetical protein [Frankia nepalensis]MBL7512003.1 hypothetical protein [Frankia nepalensis]
MGEGFSVDAYRELCDRLGECAVAWREVECIPRLAANILADILPAMESVITLYGDAEKPKIREAMYSIQELIWECVAIDPGELE